MKRTLATVFLCLLLATPAWAGFDEGVAAYHRGDYATALREFRPLAEQGDAAAQWLPRRALQALSTTSASCTTREKACRRIMPKR